MKWYEEKDAENDVIVASRIRLLRNLRDYKFPWKLEEEDAKRLTKELEEKLSPAAFEVEELIPLDAGISKVVVGKIVEMEPQEGTHLTKCVVDCGEYGHDIRISTGAANMKLGDCVPAALDGSTLPGGIKIKARKMQGVESNGMLCSGEELGLNDDLFPALRSTACSSCPRTPSPAPTSPLWWVWMTTSSTSPSPQTVPTASPCWVSPARWPPSSASLCTCPPWITTPSATPTSRSA